VRLKIDDSLDVFAVHGVGGILGSLLVAYLALPAFGGLGLADGVTAGSQFMVQLASLDRHCQLCDFESHWCGDWASC